MNPVEVATGQLRDAASQLTATGTDTDSLIAGFSSQIEGLGQPWGNDMLGMAIGTIYQAAMELILGTVGSNLDVMDNLANRLDVAAQNYDLTDQEVSANLQSIDVPAVGL